MAIAGQIEYTVVVNTDGMKKGLNQAEKEVKSFSQQLGDTAKKGAKAFGKTLVAGFTASTIAVAKLGKEAIESYAEFEQLKGGIESMFGGIEEGAEQINAVNALAKDAWKDLTLSQNEYFQSFSSAYPLMKADIEDENRAIEQTNKLLTLESDLANTFGYSMETASNAINWALKGSFNYLDNLNIGIKGTQEGFLEAAKNAGYVVDNVKDLSSEQILDILRKTADQYGVLGKTADEASTTIQGSLKMLKASWQNLLTGMADENANVNELMTDFLDSVGIFGKNLLPVIRTTLKGIVNIFETIAPEIIQSLPDIIMELLPALIEATKLLILGLIENLPSIIQVMVDNIPVIVPLLVDSLFELVGALIPRLPEIIGLLIQALFRVVVSLIQGIFKNVGQVFVDVFNNGIKPFFEGIFSFFGDFAEGAIKAFSDFGNGIKTGVENIGKWFHDVFQGIWDFITGVFKNIGDFFAGVWNKIASIFTGIGTAIGEAVSGAFKAVVNGILGFIEGFINAPVHILNTFIDAINWAFGFIGVNLGKIPTVQLPRMAQGGIVPSSNGGHLIVAGEGGQDEWVVPESKMADMIQKINEQGGTGSGITINIQGVFATSDAEQRAVAEQIYNKLQEINKSRMGAYL